MPVDGYACEIHPCEKMRDLIAPDSERDFQYMSPPYPLTETGVETRTCMLDVSKVKNSGIRDGLNVVRTVTIRVCARNGLAIDNTRHFTITYQATDVLLTVAPGPFAGAGAHNPQPSNSTSGRRTRSPGVVMPTDLTFSSW